MRYKLLLISTIAFITLIFNITAQAQFTSSPYSMHGVGEIDNRTYGINSGMAGTGIGLRLVNHLNPLNPASLVIDTLNFTFDVSTAGRISQYTYGNDNNTYTNMAVKKIAVGFRVYPKWSVSIGLRPYSNVGYKLTTQSPIEGASSTYPTEFEGSGGLNKLYLSNSYKLTKNLSVGVNASFLFGTVNQTENQYEFLIERESYTRKITFDFGLQYSNKINNTLSYTLGAVYGYKNNIKLYNDLTITSNTTGIIHEESVKKSVKTATPQFFGVGASATKFYGYRVFTFAADYIFENWDAVSRPSPTARYANTHKVSVGAQYVPNIRLARNYWQKMTYQIGASFNTSNIQIRGEQLKDYAVSIGFNFPISRSYVHFSTDFGYQTGKGLINQKYIMFTLGASISEMWFFKRFYD